MKNEKWSVTVMTLKRDGLDLLDKFRSLLVVGSVFEAHLCESGA
jgi:hypothetical protein